MMNNSNSVKEIVAMEQTNDVGLQRNSLQFTFAGIHESARCQIDFQRTLRIPDDNRDYPLPPGLGRFPLLHVEDHADRLPESMKRRGGVMMPIYQSEAMWLNFHGEYPCAIKVATGKVNAITGEPWDESLSDDPQNYLSRPSQPWLDGYCVSEGLVRQFVAQPLGAGYTAEEQITGESEFGGLQIMVYPMKRDVYEQFQEATRKMMSNVRWSVTEEFSRAPMGLAPGGLMRQVIDEDEHGLGAWDMQAGVRCFVHLLNSEDWKKATGEVAPTTPVSAKSYTDAGLPWFEHYNDNAVAIAGAVQLATLQSVGAMTISKGKGVLENNDPINPDNIGALNSKSPKIDDGDW